MGDFELIRESHAGLCLTAVLAVGCWCQVLPDLKPTVKFSAILQGACKELEIGHSGMTSTTDTGKHYTVG